MTTELSGGRSENTRLSGTYGSLSCTAMTRGNAFGSLRMFFREATAAAAGPMPAGTPGRVSLSGAGSSSTAQEPMRRGSDPTKGWPQSPHGVGSQSSWKRAIQAIRLF